MKNKKKLIFIILLYSINVFANDGGLYDFKWLDDGEKVYVIQNKEHVKAKSIGIDLSLSDSDSSPYQDTSGLMLTTTYYFSEKWSMDFTYKKYNNKNSADFENLINAYDKEVKPLVRKIDSATLVHVNWIPFYGKINTFNRIFFFDWGVGIGYGQFETQGNWKTFLVKNKTFSFEKEVDTGINFRSFVKFFTRSGMTFGFEYNLSGVETIKDQNGKKEVMYYTDIIGSIGYLF